MQSLISVIIPVYNGEETLFSCLKSVQNQSYSSYECIVVDDGSTDNSLEIFHRSVGSDIRFRVITKENGGVSSARNLGLSMAKGEYITFVDADDILPKEALSFISSAAESDLVIAHATCLPNSCFELNWPYALVEKDYIGEFLRVNWGSPLLNSPWAKLFKKDIIENYHIRFDERFYFGEDSVFLKEYILYVGSISICRDICYFYRDNAGGVYGKYSHQYESLYEFYRKSSYLTQEIEHTFDCRLNMSGAIHVLYNLTVEYLKKCSIRDSGIHYAKDFLTNQSVVAYLLSCHAVGMRIMVFLAKYCPLCVLPFAARVISCLKS